MTDTTLSSLVLILLAAAAAPVLSDVLGRWVAVPAVVVEIGSGILIGPVLHWAHEDQVITFLSDLGLATLMFLAGLDIDLARIRGGPLRHAVTGWLSSLVLGLVLAAALAGHHGTRAAVVIGLAVTTTALGTLLPILHDNGELRTPFGTQVLAGAAVGELGPLVAIALLLSTDRPVRTVLMLACFVAIALVASLLALQPRGARLGRLLDSTLTTSGQLAVRLVMLFIGVMAWVAEELGLDVLLGAFAAGMVFRLFSAGAGARETELVEAKLIGLGFGFFTPLFFVVSGMRFHLDAIVKDPVILFGVPAFLLAFLVVRGGPTFLLHRGPAASDRFALAFYLATELPLVVVITAIGVRTGRLSSATAAALVAAAMLSVLAFPLIASRLRRSAGTAAGQAPP
jgi:Kef-type K+ transport system membrane component KefB